ncbi:MAG: hypothetical protein EB015_18435, partial [Methylocystaceae bacterium]|nr:hypothetical protein [Methylocystaceae bacterium]
YPLHEREARVKGVPMLGSGRVYPIAEEKILIEPFAIPAHYARIVGIDFGYDHPFCAAWLAWDRDSDTVYVTDLHKVREETAVLHAAAIKARGGDWMPIAWPHDGLQSEKSSGESLASQYRKQGLRMLGTHARFEDGGNSVEAGIMLTLERMQTGRLKIFSHLGEWLDEFRLYHRKDGRIVKEHDDLLDATRYALMMLKYARPKPDFSQSNIRMAEGINYNILDYGNDDAQVQRKGIGVAWGNPSRESLGLDKKAPRIAQDRDYDWE